MKILIADDDADVRRVLASSLAEQGHELFEAGDGERALELARAHGPAAVFLDVLMPRLNGYEVLAKLRAEGFGGRVVIVSALTDSTAKRLSTGVKPDGTLHKPFKRNEVSRMLEKLVPRGGG